MGTGQIEQDRDRVNPGQVERGAKGQNHLGAGPLASSRQYYRLNLKIGSSKRRLRPKEVQPVVDRLERLQATSTGKRYLCRQRSLDSMTLVFVKVMILQNEANKDRIINVLKTDLEHGDLHV